MTDLAWLSVAEGSQLLRAQKALAGGMDHRRCSTASPRSIRHYNAFLVVTADKALAQAKAAEAEIAKGQWRGPMHGVPYAAKDIFDIEGMATTCHSKIRKDHRAAADAFVIRKLRDAGAVLLGKLALHEFATGGPAFDLPWPPARNPVEPRPASRRLVERLGRGARRGPGAGRARHRHRRLGAQSRDLLRHRRPEADLRRGVSLVRRVPADLFARPRRADDAHASRTTRSCSTPSPATIRTIRPRTQRAAGRLPEGPEGAA